MARPSFVACAGQLVFVVMPWRFSARIGAQREFVSSHPQNPTEALPQRALAGRLLTRHEHWFARQRRRVIQVAIRRSRNQAWMPRFEEFDFLPDMGRMSR